MRCRFCGGNLYTEEDRDARIVELKCMLCGRVNDGKRIQTKSVPDDTSYFGDWLRGVSIEQGISAAQIAYRVGVQWSTVDGWMKGYSKPRLHHLGRLAALFDTPLHEIEAMKLHRVPQEV